MAFTMQDLCDRARGPLQDAKKTRYLDVDLLGAGNAAIQTLLDKRPDLFITQFNNLPGTLALGATFPLDDRYFQPVADYVTARARSRSAEEVVKSQAQAFFQLFDYGTAK